MLFYWEGEGEGGVVGRERERERIFALKKERQNKIKMYGDVNPNGPLI